MKQSIKFGLETFVWYWNTRSRNSGEENQKEKIIELKETDGDPVSLPSRPKAKAKWLWLLRIAMSALCLL